MQSAYHGHQYSNREGRGEFEYREAGIPSDRFPYFSDRLLSVWLPYKFKPSNHAKYNGKTEPNQWLHIYSQSIELAGDDDDIKVLYFPMALDTVPLTWFDRLRAHYIDTWGQLQHKFYENFYGILTHPSTRNELRTYKQKPDETFQQYYHCFVELRA